MNMTLFKTPRFLVLYLLLQSEIAGRPYRRSANLTIRTNDAMHHSATGVCAISSMILAFRPSASIRDLASIRGNTVGDERYKQTFNLLSYSWFICCIKKNTDTSCATKLSLDSCCLSSKLLKEIISFPHTKYKLSPKTYCTIHLSCTCYFSGTNHFGLFIQVTRICLPYLQQHRSLVEIYLQLLCNFCMEYLNLQ